MEGYRELVTTVLPTGELPPESGRGPTTHASDEAALLRSENAELRALLAIQGDLGRGSTPKEVLQEVVGQVNIALGARHVCALLRDTPNGVLEPAASAGFGEATVAALKQAAPDLAGTPAFTHALAGERPLPIEDARASELLPAALASTLGLGALLLLPIRGLAREAIGVLLLDFERGHGDESPLTAERVRLAGAVIGQLTLLLQNAMLYEQLRRRTLRLEALNDVGLGLAAVASSEPSLLFARLHHKVLEVVDGTLCLLAILDDNGEAGAARPGPRGSRTMTVWRANDAGAVQTYRAVSLESDALSAALRSGRRAVYATSDAFTSAALPATLGDEPALASAIYLPLRLRRRTFGALAVLGPRPYAYAADQIEFLATVAAQAAVALEHGRLYGVLRAKGDVRQRLLDQTLQAQEAERKALVDGVLDGALQELASCSYRLDLCIRLSELEQHDRCRDELGQTRRQLAERIEDLRTMIGGLRPTNLDLLGLQSVLRDELQTFQQQTGVQTTFQGRFKERLDSAVETRAYRIAQELLANIRRHAEAKHVLVELRSVGNEVVLSIADDGVGFDAEDVLHHNAGMGLHAVREGAEILGGVARVQSRPGAGTRIEVVLPRMTPERGGSQGQRRG
jgi:signal transduction histidine kinase